MGSRKDGMGSSYHGNAHCVVVLSNYYWNTEHKVLNFLGELVEVSQQRRHLNGSCRINGTLLSKSCKTLKFQVERETSVAVWPTQEMRGRTKRRKSEKPLTQLSAPRCQLIFISIWSMAHFHCSAERDFEQGGHLPKATQASKRLNQDLCYVG